MYVASKGLVHRDLAARNILLTTGLRAKISGFNFCSFVGDDDFEPAKASFKYLPMHWMAIEAITHGKFCENSDVYVLLIPRKFTFHQFLDGLFQCYFTKFIR